MPFFKRTTTLFDQQLEALSCKVVASVEKLVELIEHPERAEELATVIGELEHSSDRILRDTFALQTTRIGVSDRSDLTALLEGVDDIVDVVDAAAERLWLHQCGEATPEAKALVDVLLRSANKVHELVALLKTLREPQEVLEICLELDTLESEGDEVYRRAMLSLFSGQYDALHIARWKDVYERLERGINRCEDVAQLVAGLVQAIA